MSDLGSLRSLDEKPVLYRQLTVAEAQRNKRWMIGGACIILIGVFFFILGITILFILYPIVYEKVIYKMVQLKPWTEEWEAWVEPPLPIYYDFVFFHISNAEEFELGLDVKPNVMEVGPYAYLEAMQKKHIFMTDVDKVSYGQYTEFYYNQTETDR